MENPNAVQVGGSHYKSEFQHWDFACTVLMGRYLEGCVTKYISRWRKKNGLEDLKKSRHYLIKAITLAIGPHTFNSFLRALYIRWMPSYPSLLNNRPSWMPGALVQQAITDFCESNSLGPVESRIMHLVADWAKVEDLQRALELIDGLIAEEQVIHDEIEVLKQENP